jgi:hypothetical protein
MKAHEYAFCPECGNKLEGDEFLCPSCGFKLADRPPIPTPMPPQDLPDSPPELNNQEPPVIPTSIPEEQPDNVPPVLNEQAPPIIPPEPVIEQAPPIIQPSPQPEPIYYQTTPQHQYVPPKKKSKVWLVIVLILLGIIIIGGGVGAFFIYNGTIPKDKVSFIPENILEMLTPPGTKSTNTVVIPTKSYYVTYAYGLVDNKKVAIISSVMDPSNSEKSNKTGAETSFLESARINYPKDYFLLTKSMNTKVFNDRQKALTERENIKKDFKKKGYELRLMEVRYHVN